MPVNPDIYTPIPDIIGRLRALACLEGALICEEFTASQTHRPVLRTTVSVGLRATATQPVSVMRHRIRTAVQIELLFPCGIEHPRIAETIYLVSAAFVGRQFHYLSVESAEVQSVAFDSNVYGVRAVLCLKLISAVTLHDPQNDGADRVFCLGDVVFDGIPDVVTETHQKAKDTSMTACPRRFTLVGTSAFAPCSELWQSIRALMNSDAVIALTLPGESTSVNVKPEACTLTSGGATLCGFEYRLEFVEAM